MTISTTTVKTTVLGNGVQTVFNYSFLMPTVGQYALYLTDIYGAYTLVPQANYTVSGIGNPAGGTFTYAPAIATGESLTLVRDVPDTQTTNYSNQAAYYPQTVEGTFDRVVMQVQQLAEQVGRAWLAPIIEGVKPAVPILSDRAGLLAAWDDDGNLVGSGYSPGGDSMPHFIIYGDQSIVHSPLANPFPRLSSFVVTGETVSETMSEFLVSFGFLSNKGAGQTLNDKVTLYAGLEARAGTGDVWSLNTVLTTFPSSGTGYNALGFELDINNLNQHYGDTPGFGGLFPPLSYGLVITGNNAYRHTAAIAILAAQPQTYNRGIVIDQSVMQASFQDLGIADRSLSLEGQFDIGLSLESGTFAIAPILMPNNTYLTSLNTASSAFVQLIGVDGTNSVRLGEPGITALMLSSANFIPSFDNTYALGLLTERWTEVYAANGVINTSGRAAKADMRPAPSMIELVRAIEPQSYRMLVGGSVTEDYEEVVEVPVTEEVVTERTVPKVVNGVARMVKESITSQQKVYDVLPVLDSNDVQLTVHTAAKPAVYDAKGHMLRAAVAAIDTPMVKNVPRMTQQTVTKTRMVARPGKRTHYGFAADDFKKTFEAHGLGDFGGYVADDKGNEGLRADQILALLWQAVREIDARVVALEP